MNMPAHPVRGDWFAPGDLSELAAAYPGRSARVGHQLHGHPLFALDALADLAARLPASHVEHAFGKQAVEQDPTRVGKSDMPVADIVRGIADNGCWIVMKKVDSDPAYAAMIDACLAGIAGVVVPKTGPYLRREAFIFLSSPGALTPFHMDPEHNILLQIAGTKTMRVYPCDDLAIVSQAHHEAFHRGGGHRNMRFDPAFDAAATDYPLEPGGAVYVPVKAPHWVQNGPGVSISFSITWRSTVSDGEARVHRVNHRLRSIGITPSLPGTSPAMDAIKIAAHRAVKGTTGVVRRLLGKERERAAY